MLGFRLFRHAVLMLIDNLGPAFRISLIPFAVFVGFIILVGLPLDDPDRGRVNPLAIPTGLAILAMGVTVFCLVAVAWHRYVLLEEYPGRLGPRWNGPEMWAYFLASLRITFGTVFVGAIAGAALGVLGAVTGEEWLVPGNGSSPIFTAALSYFSIRISLVLPAAALGEHMSIWTSWKISSPFAWEVLIAMVLVNLLVSIPTLLAGTVIGEALAMVSYFVFAGWLQVMLSISLLTALYGHIVQQRPLR